MAIPDCRDSSDVSPSQQRQQHWIMEQGPGITALTKGDGRPGPPRAGEERGTSEMPPPARSSRQLTRQVHLCRPCERHTQGRIRRQNIHRSFFRRSHSFHGEHASFRAPSESGGLFAFSLEPKTDILFRNRQDFSQPILPGPKRLHTINRPNILPKHLPLPTCFQPSSLKTPKAFPLPPCGAWDPTRRLLRRKPAPIRLLL